MYFLVSCFSKMISCSRGDAVLIHHLNASDCHIPVSSFHFSEFQTSVSDCLMGFLPYNSSKELKINMHKAELLIHCH